MNIWKKRYDEMIETCSFTARQRDEALESLAVVEQKSRPDSEGWWSRLSRGTRGGDQWEIGKAEMIYWEESGEPEQERVLAWSTGGAWTRCDYINQRTDTGTRWFKQMPPIRHND